MAYTLKQAAESVGRGKPAILRAIQRGIISATRNERGEWIIDPAELHRVYAPIQRIDALNSQESFSTTPVEHRATDIFERENALLREQIDLLKDERLDLRRRLDQATSELSRLTLMITHDESKRKSDGGALWRKVFKR